MKESNTSNSSSISATLLGITFIVLKLTHVIDWSWWWVLAPFWGGFAILLFVLAVFGLFVFIDKRKK
jgi:phosphoglycerol transferase MdoB-like AlkP superfamily enzyme